MKRKAARASNPFGEYLKDVMEQKNLSRLDVQRRSGHRIHETLLFKWMREEVIPNPTAKTIKALAAGLGEPPERVLSVLLGKKATKGWNNETLKLVDEKWSLLTKEQKKEVAGVIEALGLLVGSKIERLDTQ